jgi:NAD(P)-dependent dehydrogenase (short-subunit alcohol dehydrogenase family)
MGVLSGKAVVITGAGRGMGETHARLAAAEGARVVVNDVDADVAERVAASIREAGGEALARVADISSWNDAEALVQFCVSSFGALDGFVNNAALFHMALAQEENEARVRRIFEVNVLGTAFCGYAALRQMLRQGRGSLVNITSGAHAGIRGMSAYGGTKGATASLTYNWALDVEGSGVRVNAVSPMAQTRMLDATEEFARTHGNMAAHRITIPPENNSPLVIFLLSDLAKGVNGQVVRVQGSAMNIGTHPAALSPGVERDKWTVKEVAKAFATRLAKQQLPLGVQSYNVKVHSYSVPYATDKSGKVASAKKKTKKSAARSTARKASPKKKAARRAKR